MTPLSWPVWSHCAQQAYDRNGTTHMSCRQLVLEPIGRAHANAEADTDARTDAKTDDSATTMPCCSPGTLARAAWRAAPVPSRRPSHCWRAWASRGSPSAREASGSSCHMFFFPTLGPRTPRGMRFLGGGAGFAMVCHVIPSFATQDLRPPIPAFAS